MDKYRCILTGFLSLLVIYAGIGMSVIRYCCNGCKDMGHCQTETCMLHAEHRADDACAHDDDDDETGVSFRAGGHACTVAVYRTDLSEQPGSESHSLIRNFDTLYRVLPDLLCLVPSPAEECPGYTDDPPLSLAASSRRFLALYSTLLI